MSKNLHLRVENAGGPLDNRDGLVVGGDSKDSVLRVLQNSNELQAKILGMEVGGEGVGHSLFCASRDLDGVLLCSKVAHNLGLAVGLLEQRATNNAHANGLGLVVGDGQASFSGMAVDKLNAENF